MNTVTFTEPSAVITMIVRYAASLGVRPNYDFAASMGCNFSDAVTFTGGNAEPSYDFAAPPGHNYSAQPLPETQPFGDIGPILRAILGMDPLNGPPPPTPEANSWNGLSPYSPTPRANPLSEPSPYSPTPWPNPLSGPPPYFPTPSRGNRSLSEPFNDQWGDDQKADYFRRRGDHTLSQFSRAIERLWDTLEHLNVQSRHSGDSNGGDSVQGLRER